MDKSMLGYLFDSSFQKAYLERGVDANCHVDFLDEVPSAS
jgi:hypothetical protein